MQKFNKGNIFDALYTAQRVYTTRLSSDRPYVTVRDSAKVTIDR